jgi:hypothetical protein
MLNLLYRRTDGTFVANINNLPYHVTLDDALFPQAQAIAAKMGDALPFEPLPDAAQQPPLMPPLTRRQLRLALLRLGMTGAQVEAQIATMPGTPAEREAALIEWQDSATYRRDHPLVIALGAALGMTDAQIDDAWQKAAFL